MTQSGRREGRDPKSSVIIKTWPYIILSFCFVFNDEYHSHNLVLFNNMSF